MRGMRVRAGPFNKGTIKKHEAGTEVEISLDKKKTLIKKWIFYKIDWNGGRVFVLTVSPFALLKH